MAFSYGNLNPRQMEAVNHKEGPLLVLAGAGSGKTTVLVKRIAFIIKYGNAYMNDSVPANVTEEQVARLEGALALSTEEIEDKLSTIEYVKEVVVKDNHIDVEALSKHLNCPVVETVSTSSDGLKDLINKAIDQIGKTQKAPFIQEDLINASKYAQSIIKALGLFTEYYYGTPSLKKYILNSIQNIFNGSLQLEELLEESRSV